MQVEKKNITILKIQSFNSNAVLLKIFVKKSDFL